MNYDDVYRTIKEWGTSTDEPYDVIGVVHFLIASIENLRENALDAELDDIPFSLTQEQANFLIKIAETIKEHKLSSIKGSK